MHLIADPVDFGGIKQSSPAASKRAPTPPHRNLVLLTCLAPPEEVPCDWGEQEPPPDSTRRALGPTFSHLHLSHESEERKTTVRRLINNPQHGSVPSSGVTKQPGLPGTKGVSGYGTSGVKTRVVTTIVLSYVESDHPSDHASGQREDRERGWVLPSLLK